MNHGDSFSKAHPLFLQNFHSYLILSSLHGFFLCFILKTSLLSSFGPQWSLCHFHICLFCEHFGFPFKKDKFVMFTEIKLTQESENLTGFILVTSSVPLRNLIQICMYKYTDTLFSCFLAYVLLISINITSRN